MTPHDGYDRDTHRYLDGEPHAMLGEAERAGADRLLDASRALRSRLGASAAVRPDPARDDAVMAAIRAAPRRRGWAWAFEPRTVHVRPLWVPLAAAAAVALWLAVPRRAPQAPAPLAAVVRADTVYVHFSLVAPEAQRVALAGDFTGWQPDLVELVKDPGGHWTVTLPLVVGEHRYQFVLDGARWLPDPRTEAVDDGFGGRNSVIVVGPRGVVRS